MIRELALICILFFSIAFSQKCFAQNFLYQGSLEYRTAVSNFSQKRYNEALPLFQELIKKYPKDPAYNYYTGACMALCNVSLDKAIEILKYASAKSVPYNVYFFLGKAYHLDGQYLQAIKYYNRFDAYAKRNEKEEFRTDVLISQCNTGAEFGGGESSFTPKVVFAEKYLASYLNKLSVGLFYKVSIDISHEQDEIILKREITNLIPSDVLLNEQIIISAISDVKQGIDIHKAIKTSNDTWDNSESLSNIINTPYDDAYPFYDSKNKILYFSNNGPGSIGGYDIFYSKYDESTNKWLTPVNMGSRINSTSDDYFFLIKQQNGTAYFVSNRGTHIDSLGLYALNYSGNDKQFTNIDEPTLLESVKNEVKEEVVQNNEALKNELIDAEIIIEEKKFELDNTLELSYDEIINNALKFQLESDSLMHSTKVLRKEMQTKNTSQEKSLLYRKIKEIEGRSKEIQARADILYQQAREMELSEVENQSLLYGSNIKDNKTQNYDISITDNVIEEPTIKDKNEISKLINTFEILSKSPYSDENPIPLDVTFSNGIIYRLQLGAYSKKVTWDKFGGLTPVTGESIPERNITKYYVGLFTTTKHSLEALARVKEYGYKDAFIVSYFNGKKVSLQRARDIESTLTN